MANEKGQVDIGFKADITDLRNKLSDVSGITDKEAKQMVTSLERAFRKAEKAAAKAAKNNKTSWLELYAVVGLAGQAYNNVVKPITEYIGKQAEAIDQIADLSAKTQISGDNIQALQMAFEQTGMTFEQVDGLLSKFSANLGKAATVGGKSAKMFDLLNIETRDTHGVIKDTNVVFEDAIQKIGDLKTPAEQAAAATALFGAEGANLLTAFGDVSSFDQYLKISKEYGLDVGPEATAAAAEWETATYSLGLAFKKGGADLFKAFGTNGTEIVKVFGAVVSSTFSFIGTFIGEMIKMWKTAFGTIGDFITKLGDGTATLSDAGDALAAFSKFTPLNIIELPRIFGAAKSAADKGFGSFMDMSWSLNNIAQSAKNADQNLGSMDKTAKGIDLGQFEIDPLVLEVPDQTNDVFEEQMAILSDLAGQYRQNAIAQLTPAQQILANLDLEKQRLQSIADENADNAAIQDMVNGLQAQADLKAKNELLGIAKEEIDKQTAAWQAAKDAQQQHVVDTISGLQGGLGSIVGMVGGPVAGAVADMFLNSRETISGLKEELMSIPDILNDLPALITDFVTVIATEVVPAIIEGLPTFITALVDSVPEIIMGLVDALPILISAIIEAIPQIIYGIINAIPEIIVALVSAIPEVAKALVEGVISYFVDGVWEMAKAFWEALKDFFVPKELFDRDPNTTTVFGDTIREIVTLGNADTNTYNDTPGVVRAGPHGMRARLGAGDYMAAARNPKDLLKQALDAQPELREPSVSGLGYVQWADGAFAYDSFTKRHIRKKGAIYRQLYGRAA